MRGRVRVSAAEGLRAAVLADIGLTITSEWMFAPELASGERSKRLAASLDAAFAIDLWAVFPTGRMASAKARLFAELRPGDHGRGQDLIIPRRHKPYRSRAVVRLPDGSA